MNVSASKEKILKKIRKALSESTPIPFPESEGQQPVFAEPAQELELLFAEEFTHLLGKFVFCIDESELVKQLHDLINAKQWKKLFSKEPAINSLLAKHGLTTDSSTSLETADASITSCECLVARTGSVLLSSAQEHGRTASVFTPVHICIAYTSQLVYDIKDALQFVRDKYQQQLPSLLSFATGPSRTADIEKTLVVGVHGPKEVYVFLVDQPPAAK
jgi:L-lactate dehydrogenase complex protein LldG